MLAERQRQQQYIIQYFQVRREGCREIEEKRIVGIDKKFQRYVLWSKK